MHATTAIVSILGALLLGAMSPGPSFVLVARNAIGLSRSNGIATALAMGVGGIAFAGVALCGLYALLAAVGWLYVTLKIAGGIYLVYLASTIFRGAADGIYHRGRLVHGRCIMFFEHAPQSAVHPLKKMDRPIRS